MTLTPTVQAQATPKFLSLKIQDCHLSLSGEITCGMTSMLLNKGSLNIHNTYYNDRL